MAIKVTIQELSKHATAEDCWILVNGHVYDLTRFAPSHPGGFEAIYRHAGIDATDVYNLYHAKETIDKTLNDSEKKGAIDETSITPEWLNAQKPATRPANDDQEKPPLETLINLNDFEEVFTKYGNPAGNAYITGVSNDGLTANANKAFWHKLWFRPRILRNVNQIKTETRMLGTKVKMPVFISPMGIAKVAGPQGELALGAGAASSGIVHCLSTAASLPIEEVLNSVPPSYPYFFQLYVDKDRSKTEQVLKKLEVIHQVKAIFVTVDLPVVSKREVDERMRAEEIKSAYAKSNQEDSAAKKGRGLARATGSFIDSRLSWSDIPWLRRHTTKPLVIKGIQTVEDARMALEMGCQGIVVSNHGGRSLDSAPATILVLLELRRDCPQIFNKMEVYIDGGIRRGSDILKAVLLGARGIGVGRPFQRAVLYDKEGVEAVGASKQMSFSGISTRNETDIATVLQDELETAMRLCGVTDLDAVRGDITYLNTAELKQYLPRRPRKTRLFARLLGPRL